MHDADDKTQNCGLSCARAAGNDKRAACERTNDRLTLLWRKGNRKLTFQKRYLLLRIQEQQQTLEDIFLDLTGRKVSL